MIMSIIIIITSKFCSSLCRDLLSELLLPDPLPPEIWTFKVSCFVSDPNLLVAVQKYSPASCSVALRIMQRTPVTELPDLMYSILTGPPKPSEKKSSITAQLNYFKKVRSRTLIKLKSRAIKRRRGTSYFHSQYSSSRLLFRRPLWFVYSRQTSFPVLCNQTLGSLIKSIIHNRFLTNRIQR